MLSFIASLPSPLTIPCVRGKSALLVFTIFSLSPSMASQVQPLPKFPFESAANCFLKASNPPRSRSIKAATFPVGFPPPLALMQFQ
jgi:hypothetical protein